MDGAFTRTMATFRITVSHQSVTQALEPGVVRVTGRSIGAALRRSSSFTIGVMPPVVAPSSSMPLAVRLWFVVAFALLGFTGLLLGRVVEFIDFSERAPFSLLGIFMMVELAAVLFGITTALQRKRIAWRFAIGIAFLPVPILAGLPPVLLELPPTAAAGWYLLTVPIGLVLTVGLLAGLLRQPARDWFNEV